MGPGKSRAEEKTKRSEQDRLRAEAVRDEAAIELQRDQARWKHRRFILEKLTELAHWPSFFISAAIPLWVLAFVLEPFAGKDTKVEWKVSIAVALTGVPALIHYAAVRKKLKAQGKELQRLRAVIQEREQRIQDLEAPLIEGGLKIPDSPSS